MNKRSGWEEEENVLSVVPGDNKCLAKMIYMGKALRKRWNLSVMCCKDAKQNRKPTREEARNLLA